MYHIYPSSFLPQQVHTHAHTYTHTTTETETERESERETHTHIRTHVACMPCIRKAGDILNLYARCRYRIRS